MNPNSPNILDRQKYADFLKGAIAHEEKLLKDEDEETSTACRQKELIKKLKIRLSNYDIYNQSIPYVCAICNEKECVCAEANLKPKEETPEIPTLEITQEELVKLWK